MPAASLSRAIRRLAAIGGLVAVLGLGAGLPPRATGDDDGVSVLRSGALVAAWSARIGRSCVEPLLPLDDRVVAVSTDGRVSAYRLVDGKRLWSRRNKGVIEAAPAAVSGAGGMVVALAVRGRGSSLLGLDAGTGRPVWTEPLPEPSLQVAGADSLFLVLLRSGSLEARAAADGRRLWAFDRADWRPAGITVAGERILYLARDDSLFALDLEGTVTWRSTPGGRFALPAQSGGAGVAVVAHEGGVAWVAASDGTLLARGTRVGSQIGAALGTDRELFTVSTDGCVEGGDAAAAAGRWRVDLEVAVTAPPCARDDVVLITTTDGSVRALDALDGSSLWSYRSGGGFRVPALLTRDWLLLADDRGNLHAYRL